MSESSTTQDSATGSVYRLFTHRGPLDAQRSWSVKYLDSGGRTLGSKDLPITRDVLWRGSNGSSRELPSQGYVKLCTNRLWIARDGYSLSMSVSDSLLTSVSSDDVAIGPSDRAKVISNMECLAGGGASVTGFLLPVNDQQPSLSGLIEAEAFTVNLDQFGRVIGQSRKTAQFDINQFCSGRSRSESAQLCGAIAE